MSESKNGNIEPFKNKYYYMNERIKFLEKQNQSLMELVLFLKKDGYTYDQITTKMNLCHKCGDLLIKDEDYE